MEWTHTICYDCWDRKYPERAATRLYQADLATCCFCGNDTASGIYLRHDPRQLTCQHSHEKKGKDY